jgi:hypothetical protein
MNQRGAFAAIAIAPGYSKHGVVLQLDDSAMRGDRSGRRSKYSRSTRARSTSIALGRRLARKR